MGIEYEVQLLTVGPDLPLVYRVNAFAQHLKGIVPREHPLSARPKGFHDHSRYTRIQRHNDTDGWEEFRTALTASKLERGPLCRSELMTAT